MSTPSRIDQFEALLRKDEGLDLTEIQRHHVASLLAFAGVGLPLPVWMRREEIQAAPPGALIESPAGSTYQKRAATGAWWELGYGNTCLDEEIELPVTVRWLP